MARYDWGAGAGGAASGAMTGASIGSAFPVIGTGIGAVAGGIFGALGGFKKNKKKKKISTMDKKQKALYGDYYNSIYGDGPFSDAFNFDADKANENFDQMYSRPAYRQFEEKVIPGITGQFRGSNIGNSSYTGQALSRAGRDVQEGLDAHRANMIYQGSQQAQQNKMSAIDKMLNMQTFAYDKGGGGGGGYGVDEILKATAPAGADWLTNYLKDASKANVAGSVPAAP